MKKLLQLLPFLVFGLLMMSCSDNLSSGDEFVQLTPEENAKAVLDAAQNKILLVALQVNHKTNDVKGLVVDNESNLRKLEFKNATDLDFSMDLISEVNMDRMFDRSEFLEEIPVEETAKYFLLSKQLQESQELVEINEDKDVSTVYITFERNYNVIDNEDCVALSTSVHAPVAFDQIIINATGRIAHENPSSTVSLELTNWLQSFEAQYAD